MCPIVILKKTTLWEKVIHSYFGAYQFTPSKILDFTDCQMEHGSFIIQHGAVGKCCLCGCFMIGIGVIIVSYHNVGVVF